MKYIRQSKVHKLMNDALDWWVYGSFHIAFCVFSFALFSYRNFGLKPDFYYLAFIANSTFLVYSCHKLLGITRIGKIASLKRFRIVKEHTRHIVVYVLLSLAFEMVFLFTLSLNEFLLLSLAAVVAILYIIPISPNKKRLRDFWYIKIFLIASAFSFVCCFIPLYLADINKKSAILFCIMQAMYVFGLTMPFDIRDIEVDTLDGNVTLATYLGTRKSILLALMALLSITIYSGLFLNLIEGLPMLITSTSTIFMVSILIYTNKLNDFYYTFLLDGMLILPWITYEVIQLMIN